MNESKREEVDFDNIHKSTEAVVKHYNVDNLDLPYKLKLMQALGFVPSGSYPDCYKFSTQTGALL